MRICSPHWQAFHRNLFNSADKVNRAVAEADMPGLAATVSVFERNKIFI